MQYTVNGQQVNIEGLTGNSTTERRQLDDLLNTLRLIPAHHLHLVSTYRIIVGDRPAAGGGGSDNTTKTIRLNRSCFNSEWNQHHVNETLLHEVGHMMNWHFDAMGTMSRQDYDTLMTLKCKRPRHGDGERFADVYASIFKNPRGSRVQNGRGEVVLRSRAFTPSDVDTLLPRITHQAPERPRHPHPNAHNSHYHNPTWPARPQRENPTIHRIEIGIPNTLQ